MAKTKFTELKKVFETLHSEKGCLWDKKQTHVSILSQLNEEVEEFVRAVRANDTKNMQEELGDILLHVMFHSIMARKKKKFDVEDVIDGLIKKLKRRHPHVFGKTRVSSADEIIENWEKIKRREKQHAKRQR